MKLSFPDCCSGISTAAGFVGAAWIAVRKGNAMFKVAQQVLVGVLLVAAAVELESQGNGQKGEEKKQAAIRKFQETVDPLLPDWLNPVIAGVLGMLIDTVVAWATRTGFFGQLAGGSNSLPLKP